jgi:exosortase/archaeosortase family protein
MDRSCDRGDHDGRKASSPETSRQLRFLAAVLLLAPALLAGYTLPRESHGPAGRLIAGYLRLDARIGAALVRPIDPSAHAIGSEIRGRASVILARERDAIDIIFPFIAALLVFPAALRRRAVGMGLGVVALSALNLIRIKSLYWLALENTAAFELAEREFFPVLMVTLAIVGFFGWVRWASHEATD